MGETGQVRGWNPGQSELPNTALLKEQFETLIGVEKNLLTEIRERERAFALLLNKMSEERLNSSKLKKDPNTASNVRNEDEKQNNKQIEKENESTHANANKEDADCQMVDEYSMLKSFLPKVENKKNELNKEQIDQIKEDCLRSLKERLVERLNIITRRLHAEIECLESAKTEWENYQNNSAEIEQADDAIDDETELQRENEHKALKKECEFKIKIIKQRLARHERLSIQRMNKLAQMLDTYPNY